MDKEEARSRLKLLVNNFRINYQKYKNLAEADIETKLVEELFINVLGWSKDDFIKQERTQRNGKRGRADYAFYIGDRIVFFLEVKRIGIPLEKEADRQVISYALSKRIPFAVSTNFEELKIFCVEQENAIDRVFRRFKHPEAYLEDFHDLLFLAKESFENNDILKKAEDEDRLKKRISIDRTLLNDLIFIRKLIADDIEKTQPNKYDSNEKDDIVQRIIDRLIFIRRCEDTSINPDNLYLEEIKEIEEGKAYLKLKKIFQKYNEVYNSGLFAVGVDNDCDSVKINDSIIKKLVGYLYESKDKQYIYNFDWIDADVLGQIYEQYLGKILQQTKSGRSKLKEGQAHRKEQGIYYTPIYIVDYIIKNTIGEIAKKKNKIKDIKVLDPACGSGSFLIKAFDYIYRNLSDTKDAEQLRFDSQGIYSIKTEMLKNNLYGVDLDNKAVEITKLNLLLKASEKYRKLPSEIDLHVRHGNSLIEDEKVAGLNAFKWSGDFEQESFDVIVGNPPYIRPENVDKTERDYYINSGKFDKMFGRFDLYLVFMERALKLLKKEGYFSFIIPYSFLNQNYSKKLREWILKEFTIMNLIDLSDVKVFEQALVNTCILVIKKKSPSKNHKIKLFKPPKEIKSLEDIEYESINQDIFLDTPQNMIRTDLTQKKIEIIEKIKQQSVPLSDICYCVIGSVPHDSKTGASKDRLISNKKESSNHKQYIEGKDMGRYVLSSRHLFLNYQPKVMHRPKFPELFENEKLIIRNISTKEGIMGVYDMNHYYTNDTVSLCVQWFKLQNLNIRGINTNNNLIDLSKKYNLKYLLSMVNSKLNNFYFKTVLSANLHVYPEAIRNLLIRKIDFSNGRDIEVFEQLQNIVESIQELKTKLNEFGDKNTSEKSDIKNKINEKDKKIDSLIYKLYGITDKEKEIIESSV
ncbi:MAG: N-6 DNA methylase [archaeon]